MNMKENESNQAIWRVRIENRLENIESNQAEIKHELKEIHLKFENYTHVYQFVPVRNIAYGLVSAFGVGVIGALVTLLSTGGVGGS